jgi:hypothetical protein
MKQRTYSYLGSFVNNAEGISSYKLMVKHIRQVIKGGTFQKRHRGGKRSQAWGRDFIKEESTHFDVYLHGNPTFYGFKLVANRPW